MRISTVVRHVREGVHNIARNGWMSFASISSIAISLFILGVFLFLALNVNEMASRLEKEVEIRVFIKLESTQEQIDAVRTAIAKFPEVSQVRFVSKAEGLEQMRESLGENGGQYLDGLEGADNPLNDSFTIDVYDPKTVPAVADKIRLLKQTMSPSQIEDIDYGEGTVEMLFRVTNTVRNVGLVIVAGLAITAMFLISNTIKVTILARRREIGIMKLVGATNGFIRWPFFIEGALIGIIGSIIPVVVLFYGYDRLVTESKSYMSVMMLSLIPLHEVALQIGGLLIGLGTLIGIWGSTLSIRKFLKV